MTLRRFPSNFDVPEITPDVLTEMRRLAATTEAGNPGSSASPVNGVPCRGSNGMIYLVDPAAFDTVNLLVNSGNNIRPFDLTDEPIFIGLLLATRFSVEEVREHSITGGTFGLQWYPFGHRDSQPLVLVPLPDPAPGTLISPPAPPVTGGPDPGTIDGGIGYPAPPAPTASSTNLSNFISISSRIIDRQYIKGTMRAIPKETITISNISPELEITVTLLSLAGVSFSPSTFDLPPNMAINVDILFDTSVINQYPEGLSAVNAVANLSCRTAVANPTPLPPVLPPTLPPQQPPVVPPVTGGPDPGTIDGGIGFPTPITPTPGPSTDPLIPIHPVGSQPIQPIGIPATTTYWVDGTGSDGYILHTGFPPSGWLKDPYGGEWYPPDHPFVLSGWGRGTTPVSRTLPPEPPQTPIPTHSPASPKYTAPPPTQPVPPPFNGGGEIETPFTIDDSIQFLI